MGITLLWHTMFYYRRESFRHKPRNRSKHPAGLCAWVPRQVTVLPDFYQHTTVGQSFSTRQKCAKIVAYISIFKQELSYRKQIARQLRIQYVEGIYRPGYPVTLEFKFRVTQGHWKRNHRVDHTLVVELFDVEYIMILKSGLKVTQGRWNWCHSKALVRFHSPSIATMGVSVAACKIFSFKEWRDFEPKNTNTALILVVPIPTK